jgi:hypothetical protein
MTPSNIDSNSADNAVNPITAKTGNLDPTWLRLAQSFAAGATTRTSPITARKLDPHNWYTAHPDPAFHFVTMASREEIMQLLDLSLECPQSMWCQRSTESRYL